MKRHLALGSRILPAGLSAGISTGADLKYGKDPVSINRICPAGPLSDCSPFCVQYALTIV